MTNNNCGNLFVNNSKIFGNSIPFIGFVPTKLEFSIEIYQRTPSFDSEKPVITCPEDIEVKANESDDFAIVTFQNATATDANSVTVTQTAGLSSGSQFPIGVSNIEFTATDLCGNTSTCSFTITVLVAA